MHSNQLQTAVVFVVLSSLVLPSMAEEGVASAQAPFRQAHVASPRIRSLAAACKEDYAKLCKPPVGVVACLEEKSKDIGSEVCSQWLKDRKICFEDARRNENCEKATDLRKCLVKLTKADVSGACSESDFFKSVQMFARYRRRNASAPAKGGNGSNNEPAAAPARPTLSSEEPQKKAEP